MVDTPRGSGLRPTTALVRQALFNILGHEVVDAAFLDLYAGAGTVGFEALSRGAAVATFVERDRAATGSIRGTAERLGCLDRCRVITADVVAWLGRRPDVLGAADIVYVDAPYRDDDIGSALALLGDGTGALVVCEHHRARRVPDRLGSLCRVREATYGTTQLTFWRRGTTEGGAGGDGEG